MTSTLAYITATLSLLCLLASLATWIRSWSYGTWDGGARRMLNAANSLTLIAIALAVLTGGLAL